MIIVLDTNVLVSGMINPTVPPGRIVDLLRSGILELAVDDRILLEYSEVIRRPFLSQYIKSVEADHIIEYLRGNSEYILSTRQINKLPDAGDVPFLEVALEAGVPLVTGNLQHYPPQKRHGVTIETPADSLKR